MRALMDAPVVIGVRLNSPEICTTSHVRIRQIMTSPGFCPRERNNNRIGTGVFTEQPIGAASASPH